MGIKTNLCSGVSRAGGTLRRHASLIVHVETLALCVLRTP